MSPETAPAGSRGIDEILTTARARLNRLDPAAAQRAVAEGAVLVDIRPAAQRAEHGEIPDAVIVERNVLEWRFDPRSDAKLRIAGRYDLPVIVYCQEGYTSSLAAASLLDLGLYRATDLDGGIAAWKSAGLPVTDGLTPAVGLLATGTLAAQRKRWRPRRPRSARLKSSSRSHARRHRPRARGAAVVKEVAHSRRGPGETGGERSRCELSEPVGRGGADFIGPERVGAHARRRG